MNETQYETRHYGTVKQWDDQAAAENYAYQASRASEFPFHIHDYMGTYVISYDDGERCIR